MESDVPDGDVSKLYDARLRPCWRLTM
jgi:hypothetical protein